MGSVAGALIPFEYGRWPAADPRDPTCAEDYANVLTGAHSAPMSGEAAHSD